MVNGGTTGGMTTSSEIVAGVFVDPYRNTGAGRIETTPMAAGLTVPAEPPVVPVERERAGCGR